MARPDPPTAVSGPGQPAFEEKFCHLGELLQRDAQQIMERWFQRANDEQVHASEKDRREVMDHLREMLQAIGERLCAQSHEALTEATGIAKTHGRQRAHFQWDIVDVVKDYEILHGVVLEYLGEELKERLTCRQSIVLVAVIDRAIGSAVEAFNELVQERLDGAASSKLEKQVANQTAELWEQTVRLRHLAAELVSVEQRERKRLAALLHDDLQQLLVAAKINLDRACRSDDGPDLDAVQNASRWINEAIMAARHLTHQLRPPVLYEDGLVAALYGLASEMTERHDLRVDIEGEPEPDRLSDDLKALLFDAVRELLFNVAKHAGVSEARVKVSTENDLLHVRVEDRGSGLDAGEVLESRESTGFGLFSVRERLAAMGGEMSIESRPGAGTSILLEAPLVKPGLPQPEAALEIKGGKEAPGLVKKARIRVVVADDHTIVRQGLITLLRENERVIVVGEAWDGVGAIEAVARHSPDVLLLDVNMPRMNGIEAAREINRRWPKLIIIGLSVQDDETTAKAMREAGASAFLSKGGDSDHMFSAITELVGNRRAG